MLIPVAGQLRRPASELYREYTDDPCIECGAMIEIGAANNAFCLRCLNEHGGEA
jgi:hypothetical protein